MRPVLAKADMGQTMNSLGSDVTIKTADVMMPVIFAVV